MSVGERSEDALDALLTRKLTSTDTLNSNSGGALSAGGERDLGRVKGSVEKGVDEGGLPEARLA